MMVFLEIYNKTVPTHSEQEIKPNTTRGEPFIKISYNNLSVKPTYVFNPASL